MREIIGLLCTISILLVFAGCGGDDGDSITTSASGAAQGAESTAMHAQREPESAAGRADKGKSESGAAPEPGTKAVAPGVPVQPGGDNSVQVFGVEGEGSQAQQAMATLRAYLRARAAGLWGKACAETSEEFKEQVTQLIAMASQKEKPKGCAELFERFFGGFPPAALRRSAVVRKLLSFRVKGDYAYVIFAGAGDEVRFIAMANDGGEWKVNTTEPGSLGQSG